MAALAEQSDTHELYQTGAASSSACDLRPTQQGLNTQHNDCSGAQIIQRSAVVQQAQRRGPHRAVQLLRWKELAESAYDVQEHIPGDMAVLHPYKIAAPLLRGAVLDPTATVAANAVVRQSLHAYGYVQSRSKDCKNHNYEQQSYCHVQSERRMIYGHWPGSTVDSFNSGCTNVRCGGTATRLR